MLTAWLTVASTVVSLSPQERSLVTLRDMGPDGALPHVTPQLNIQFWVPVSQTAQKESLCGMPVHCRAHTDIPTGM